MQQIPHLLEQKKIAFVAGRSGGHIIPTLSIAQREHADALFFSTDSKLDQAILQGENIQYVPLRLPNVPRNPLKLLVFGWQFMRAFWRSISELYAFKPEKVVSTGGYIALPVCLAAYVLRIPIILYELNAIPGKATSWLAPLATTINVCFAQSINYLPKKKCTLTEYPLRFSTDDVFESQETILQKLGFSQNKTTILILGGSQGSVFLNEAFKRALESDSCLRSSMQVIHQTGAQDTTDWQAFYAAHAIPAIIFEYQNDITNYYIAADMIICRSGAGTLFEIMFFKKPCITIPLETATTDHQVDNARAMIAQYPHYVIMIEQKQLQINVSNLIAAISILAHKKELQ